MFNLGPNTLAARGRGSDAHAPGMLLATALPGGRGLLPRTIQMNRPGGARGTPRHALRKGSERKTAIILPSTSSARCGGRHDRGTGISPFEGPPDPGGIRRGGLRPFGSGDAADHPVNSESDLRTAIASAVDGDTITFNVDVTLTQDLPAIQTNVTVLGKQQDSRRRQHRTGVLRGEVRRRFGTPAAVTVTIQDLTIQNARAGGGGRDGAAAAPASAERCSSPISRR